ncbi:MAG TPA: 4-hydroxy-tetrahydrodipicolinate synthase [Hyphomonadaceae bacterium]|jgi:4-hydroxy-tetrahydrodipicolinate synthase|nr:4-hydroxy-tetrahydrodipicolinate synthase [Hyphomonadaceae bacterium]
MSATFKGSWPALVTPFRDGKVDDKAFVALVERQVANGTHALVPCGTTGEASTLSHEEHRHVVELCVKTAAGRIPVIAGAGSNSTDEAISLMQHAKTVGAHAALVVNPYYNRPSQDGVYAHYKTLNDAVQLPIFLYNVPGRTGADLQPELIGRLSQLPNVIGIKDASADLSRVARHTALCGKDFVQISGEDPTAVGFNAQGGVGCISVTANVAPKQCSQMQEATLKGDYATARRINDTLARLHRAMFLEPSPSPAKYALSLLGLCTDETRLPIVPVSSAEVKKEIEAAMKEAGVL